MEILRITENDYPRIYSLWVKNNVSMEIDMSYESISKFITINPSTCLMIVDNDEIIGTLFAGFDGAKYTIYHILKEM